jgi:hypothetical protein
MEGLESVRQADGLPCTSFVSFISLVSLVFMRCHDLQGKLADVFSALSGAPGLQNINLFRDVGLDGPLAPIYTAAAASICKLAKASLQHLNLESTGAEGPIPPCLFGPGSQIVEAQLGALPFALEFNPHSRHRPCDLSTLLLSACFHSSYRVQFPSTSFNSISRQFLRRLAATTVQAPLKSLCLFPFTLVCSSSQIRIRISTPLCTGSTIQQNR